MEQKTSDESAGSRERIRDDSRSKEGLYIYCVIGTDKDRNFGPIGIGDRGDEVYTLCHNGLATVVSTSPVKKYPINRKNTIAHQKVLEEVMKDHTVLPVRFSTIAEDKDGVDVKERIKDKVLSQRYDELEKLLAEMADKQELGVKALWTDMDAVYREILEENPPIKNLRDKLKGKPQKTTHNQKVKLGEMVKKALDAKRSRLASKILEVLKGVSTDYRSNKLFGDKMIMNGAFLVQNDQVPKFDKCVDELDERLGEGIKFKYVGPVPPCNFVEIVINLED